MLLFNIFAQSKTFNNHNAIKKEIGSEICFLLVFFTSFSLSLYLFPYTWDQLQIHLSQNIPPEKQSLC